MTVTTLTAYTNASDKKFITVRNKVKNRVLWVLYVNGAYTASLNLKENSTDVVKQFGLNPVNFIKIN